MYQALKNHLFQTTLVFCLLFVSAPSTVVAFQPSISAVPKQQHSSAPVLSGTKKTASTTSSSLLRFPCLQKSERRYCSLFLASSSDDDEEEVQDISAAATTTTSSSSSSSNLPMAVSLIGSTTSILVAGTFYLALAWQRDAFMVAFFMGSIANGVLSKILKRLIGQSRPPDLDDADMAVKPSDGGMPSSHAMSLGFIGTITALHISWAPIPVLLYVVLSLWYRVQVKLHTTAQILVGATVGCAHAVVFDAFIKEGLMDWLRQYVLDSQGLLPVPLLVVPAIVGALVVGSVERRISGWLKKRQQARVVKAT